MPKSASDISSFNGRAPTLLIGLRACILDAARDAGDPILIGAYALDVEMAIGR